MKHLANLLLILLPTTRFFAVKRAILRILGIRVGEGTNVCGDVRFYGGGRIFIGNDCWIGIGTKFYTTVEADIVVEDNCDIAPEVSFVCGSHEIGNRERRAGVGKGTAIRIGKGSWVGCGATVLGGCHLGAASVVSARALLTGNPYAESVLLMGVPARVVRSLDTDDVEGADRLREKITAS
jgi:maltose O-acetyltransferase